MDTNVVVISGRLTDDQELRYVGQNNTPLSEFSIAVNHVFGSGENKKEEVSYYNVNFWGARAERLAEWLVKGKYVTITGRLKQERWETDGTKRSTTKIIVENINFPKADNRGGGGGGNAASQPVEQKVDLDAAADDIPF